MERGDPSAAEQLLPARLRRVAEAGGSESGPGELGQTLRPTALVHEAYLRLVEVDKAQHRNSGGTFSPPRSAYSPELLTVFGFTPRLGCTGNSRAELALLFFSFIV
jgi:hypothetical protein